MPFSIVRFASVTSVPYNVIKDATAQAASIRLKSPYVEHLANRFANTMGRIGIPENAIDLEGYNKVIESLKLKEGDRVKYPENPEPDAPIKYGRVISVKGNTATVKPEDGGAEIKMSQEYFETVKPV